MMSDGGHGSDIPKATGMIVATKLAKRAVMLAPVSEAIERVGQSRRRRHAVSRTLSETDVPAAIWPVPSMNARAFRHDDPVSFRLLDGSGARMWAIPNSRG